jgi:uncharacterized protein YdbL (DUF1318 family)
MKRLMSLNVALSTLAFAACVTINVYFPAAAAEKAADQIIDTVTNARGGATGSALPQAAPAPQATPQPSGPAPAAPKGGSGLTSQRAPQGTTNPVLLLAGRALEMLVPAAQAQAAANIDVSTPEIRAVTGSMQARFAQLQPYFASGAIGLTKDGLVDVRDQGSIPLAERASVKGLVAQDNQDRSALYTEIAKANGHPEWEGDIRQIFARRWVERGAQPGWYYQDAGGAWKQK